MTVIGAETPTRVVLVSPEYIAGFFDGEGSVHPYRNGYCTVRVSISQKRPEVLYAIRQTLGYGRVIREGDQHSLRIGGRNVIDFLNLVYPYLIVKRDPARIALELMALVPKTGQRSDTCLREELGILLSKANRI